MNLRSLAPFFTNPDAVRFCYLRLPLLEKAMADPRILDALVTQLEVPGKAGVLKALSDPEKIAAITRQIETFRATPTSLWRGVNAGEVLAGSIFRASLDGVLLPQKIADEWWHATRTEAALASPVAKWLKGFKLKTFSEVPLGTKRVDLLAYQEGGLLSENLCVVAELKNEGEQLKRGLDQMTTFSQYAHETYLACTPHFAAMYLDAHSQGVKVKHWDAAVLTEKLAAFGFGLLLVEDDTVYEAIKPIKKRPTSAKLDEVRFALKTAREL